MSSTCIFRPVPPPITLKAFGFGENFINWIKIILTNQESCVMNGGNSTGYFKLERGARQGDPISAYLFILKCVRKKREPDITFNRFYHFINNRFFLDNFYYLTIY